MKSTAPRKVFSPLNLLYFTLGLAVLVFLLRKIDFHSLIQLMLKIRPEYLLLGGLIYIAKAAARAVRFTRVNRRSHPGYLRMQRLSLASSLASQVLPLKLGEFSYVYLLKKDSNASIPQGLSTLMVIRIFDLLTVALLFLVISFVIGLRQDVSVYIYSIIGFVALLVVLMIGLLVLANHNQAVLDFFFRYRLVQLIPGVRKLRAGIEGVLGDLRQYQPREYLEWTLLASLEWMINHVMYYVILLGMGIPVTFYATVVGVTFSALASVLPINSFGSFGTLEAGWAAGFLLLGYPQDVAIASGFATHFLALGYILIFGGISWLSYLVTGSRRAEDARQVP